VIVLAIGLGVASVAMMLSHRRSWQTYQEEDVDAEEFNYHRGQYRRRMQTSAMLGILGVAILVGYLLTIWLRSPVFTLICWIVIILLLFWTCLLALIDIGATKFHFSRMRDRCLIEQAKLRAELNRIQAHRGNGQSYSEDEEDEE
jgi:uncharacterized membrane protein YesL